MKTNRIAIVGMAGRFPGARNLSQFWQNLRNGVESIRDRSDVELIAAGATQDELTNPDYVKRASVLDDVPMFDAAFFGFSPRDASIMDPQHRHFLECAWEALEDAGHPPHRFDGSVGVFAGSGMNTYLIHNLLANRRLLESAGLFQLKQTGNDKDVLATRVSYQFDLRGPSVNVQTACSTSLVAVHLACQSLLNFECDMALAGGVTIEIPHGIGYVYREGEILSRDGRCRSFDASSSGTVFGSGLGVVVLRRFEDALADCDNIHAVILGSAVNNDGARKVGYLAPSVEGQAEVITEALEFAGVNAAEISYVEAHGTGTTVGDPIEIRALTQAFRKSTNRSGYCGIGSLKSNVGHLDAAAGVSGLIKTALALEHAQRPPSLHFQKINPHIELNDSPFFIQERLGNWPTASVPRRAGVTALGIGGTNAHVVLEEPPRQSFPRTSKPFQLLTVSAKSEAAAEHAVDNLTSHLHANPELKLADVAFTCQLGRQQFPHRRAWVVVNNAEATVAPESAERRQVASGVAAQNRPRVVFMFSGQGSQYVGMGRDLYDHAPVFRETLDLCAKHLQPHLHIDLLEAIYPPAEDIGAAAEKLNQTWLTQPALFSIEYSLARWWISLGIKPAAMVGHSIGEYVAACLAGVFSLEDALALVSARGRFIFDLPTGSMLAVPLAASDLHLNGSLSLAAINNPELCVVSGPTPEIASLEKTLADRSIACRRLFTSHAFHSAMMDPILSAFEERIRNVVLQAPRIPYLSNVTGTWIEANEATDPNYWALHIRQTVRFSDCLAEILREPDTVLIEAGPGMALTSLARQQGGPSAKALQSLPHPKEATSAYRCALSTLGQLWVSGTDIEWTMLHAPGSAQRVSLPTYPFEHQKFWIEPDAHDAAVASIPKVVQTSPDGIEDFFYRRVWKGSPLAPSPSLEPCNWIIFRDAEGVADCIAATLIANKHQVFLVDIGSEFKQTAQSRFTLRAGVRSDYDALLAGVIKGVESPPKILHLWSVEGETSDTPLNETLDRSFYSPLFLAQALAAHDIADVDIALVSNRMQQVSEEPVWNPARAVLLGPARVIPSELPEITCRTIDIDPGSDGAFACSSQIVAEMTTRPTRDTVAYRKSERFVAGLERFNLATATELHRLKHGGVYLITGGFGGLGLVVAEHLAREFQAHLVLLGRTAPPPESAWDSFLHDPDQTASDKQRIRQLIEIRSLAGGLLISQADVTDLNQMRNAMDIARKQFGKIDGVFHCAGTLDDGPLVLKTGDSAARVLDPKVRGTLVLAEVLRDDPLTCFVLFSSISSIFPPAGQVDYAAANAFLDAFAISRKGPVTAFNWGLWQGVGMGARAASIHPFLHQRLLESPREIVYRTDLSQHQQWLLSEHRLKTAEALLPGTGFLEMVCAAFSRGSSSAPIEIRDSVFLAPLKVDSAASRELRIQLIRENDASGDTGVFRFSVFSRAALSPDWVEHCTGLIANCHSLPTQKVDYEAIASRCCERVIEFDETNRTKQEQYFIFGPRWHSLKRFRRGVGEGLAELELDERFPLDLSALRAHPALLDMATGCSLYLTEGYEDASDLYLPFAYKRVRFHRPLPGRLFSHVRSRKENLIHGEVVSFDITLFDENNQVLAEIDAFTMRRISDPAMVSEQGVAIRHTVPSVMKQPIEVSARPGISPRDGARALTRILQAAAPSTVAVLSQSLDEAEDRNVARSPRPAPQTPASPATRDSVETALASWWQELLGVEQVGLDDDFFALGGHSLIGVRLFAKIKKAYQVDLELATLFEARTVRQLAALINKSMRPVTSEQKLWSCLVPIQAKGSRTPFFFVHAIGGDVLFYELLAKSLGPEQPFYAFRSLLATQENRREITIEELASAYVKEMRSFFPHGPYLLGGLSYGGLVAFEMARQLKAQGAEPALLAVLDASVPESAERLTTATQFSILRQHLRQDGLQYLIRKAKVKRQYWGEKLLHRAHLLGCSWYRFWGKRVPIDLRYSLMEEIHLRAMQQYLFQPYQGRITLFRAIDRGEEILSKHEDPILGWGHLALGGLDIHDIPANHTNMLLDPQVRIVAEELMSILSKPSSTALDQQPAVQEAQTAAALP